LSDLFPPHPAPFQPAADRTPPKVGNVPLAKSSNATLSRRYSDADRLWPIVDSVLAVAASDSRIQRLVGDLALTRDPAEDDRHREQLFVALKPAMAGAGIRIPDPSDVPPLLQMAYDELIGISVLGELWRDPSVTEILVDRWDRITAERRGRLEPTQMSFRSPEHAASVARALALRVSERQVSRSINLVTADDSTLLGEIGLPQSILRGVAMTSRAAGLVGHIREGHSKPAARHIWHLVETGIPYEDEPEAP
jgi:hypothetical protein